MQDSCFYKYDLFEEKGSVKIRLYLDESSTEYTTEFGQEFGFFKKDSDESLKELALDFVEKNFPKIKAATIVIMAGAVLLSNFTMRKADASSQGFNMSYLYFGNTKSYIQEVDSTQGNLNVVSPSYFNINSDGSLNITNQFDPVFLKEMKMRGVKVVPFLSNHWDRNLGRAALQNRAQLAQQIADFVSANDLQGVQVDIENVTEIDRDNYTDLIKLLHEKLPAGKEVSVAVAANPDNWSRGWQGSYDYKELAKYADYLMIMTYDQSYQGSPEGPVAGLPWVERSIQAALKLDVPPEKIVLGIPFYGRYWKQGAATGGDGISNIRVDQMLAKYGGTVTYDTTASSPMATITIKDTDPTTVIAGKTLGPGTYHVWYEIRTP